MAKKITGKTPFLVRSMPPATASRDTLLEGVLAGIVNGEYAPADYRASQGPIVARGFVTMSAQRKNFQGTVVGYETRIPLQRECIVEDPNWSLSAGSTYYLHTGGGIIVTDPSSTTGDLKQVVGYAETTTVLVGCVDSPVIHA